VSLRDLINALFAQIGATSLTDEEFDALTIEAVNLDVETYEALLAVIDARELVSNTRDRLRYYYLARGVEVAESVPASSNIFVGASLCD
jgi:hypothetical protein